MHKSGLVELEAVVAIARLGSFRAAALDLDMSPTAIGNAVASLENRACTCSTRFPFTGTAVGGAQRRAKMLGVLQHPAHSIAWDGLKAMAPHYGATPF
jgi:hypothetical protein